MTPDSPLVDAVAPSPNHGERRDGARPDMLILHYTGMISAQAALARLTSPDSEVSAHYFVEEDGRILQLVPETRRAWHAGRSLWNGRSDVNSHSIGIEIVNPGHEHGYRRFPQSQIAAVIRLCKDCVERRAILPRSVLAHSDISPDRKEDPGEWFPWDQLFSTGVGHWVPPVTEGSGRFLTPGDSGPPVQAYQTMLAAYGYAVGMTGNYDDTTRLATIAFQRHFRPARIDGIADRSTVATLHALLTTD